MSKALIIATGLVAIIVIYIYFNYRRLKNTPEVTNSPKVKILSDKNFNHQIKTGVTLVDFWASWCMPCKMMAPVINEVAESVNGNASVGKLDVDQYRATAAKYKIRNIPTMILFRNGKEINRFVGAKSKDFLLKQITQAK
jgi:thioredoxin 1